MEKIPPLEQLTERERALLQALVDKRNVYLAKGNPVGAKFIGVAIWIAWQVLRLDIVKHGNK